MRTNPLSAHFFIIAERAVQREADDRALEAVREAITSVAERLRRADLQQGFRDRAERHFQAIVRCDVRRELAKRVASDLGISERHLRRERSHAQERVARALWADKERCASGVVLDVAALEFSVARQLFEIGQPSASVVAYEAIASGANNATHRVMALVALIDLAVQRGDLVGADTLLGEASLQVHGYGLGEDDLDAACGWLTFARSRIDFSGGDVEAGERHEGTVIASMAKERDPVASTRELLARALLERAKRLDAAGFFDQARKALERVGTIVDASRSVSIGVVVDHLTLVGGVSMALSGYDSDGRAALARALELSQEYGLCRRAILAGRELADMQYHHGLLAEADALTRASLAAAARLGMPDLVVDIALDLAENALMADDSTSAMPYVALARRNVSGGAQAVRLDVAESHCMLLSGNAAGALRQATAADRAAEVLGNERRRGTALRVMALAQHSLGMQADARQTILRTVSVIERHGCRGSLALALRIAAQITGRAEYARRALELWPTP